MHFLLFPNDIHDGSKIQRFGSKSNSSLVDGWVLVPLLCCCVAAAAVSWEWPPAAVCAAVNDIKKQK